MTGKILFPLRLSNFFKKIFIKLWIIALFIIILNYNMLYSEEKKYSEFPLKKLHQLEQNITNDPELYFEIAKRYRTTVYTQKAINYFLKTIDLNDDYLNKEDFGLHKFTQKYLNNIIANNPNDSKANYYLGLFNLKSEFPKKAENFLLISIKNNPEFLKARMVCSSLQKVLGESCNEQEESLKYYAKALTNLNYIIKYNPFSSYASDARALKRDIEYLILMIKHPPKKKQQLEKIEMPDVYEQIPATCMTEYDNLLWFGTWDQGLRVKGKENDDFVAFTTKKGGIPLKSNNIRCMLVAHNKLWIGTGDGLCSFDKNKWEFFEKKFSTLPSDEITALTEYADFLWIGTTKGIALYDFKHWYYIINIDMPKNASITQLKIVDENIWIGTENGLKKYLAKDFIKNKRQR